MELISFKKNGNKATAVFLITNSEFENKINIVWNSQKKWFKVPGFRKGKVPRKIIENEYGKDIFYDSALGLLYPKMIDFLIEETKEKIITIEGELYMQMSSDAKPKILNKDENSVETEVKIDIYPKVDFDYNNIQVEVEPKKKVTEDEIQAQLNMAQRQMKLKDMNSKTKVEEGDFVKLNIIRLDPLKSDGTIDQDNNKFKKFRDLRKIKIKVGLNDISPLENAIKGHTVAEGEFQENIKFPEAIENEELSGKEVRASIEIIGVKRPFDMSEVAENNGFENLDKFKEFIKDRIDKHHQNVYENNKKNKLVEKLASMIDDNLVHEDMLKGKIALVKNQYKKIAESMGQSLESFAESLGGREEFNSKINDIVKLDLKSLIALHSIAEKENIKFSDAEIEEYKNKLKFEGVPSNSISKAEVTDRITSEKVVDFLMSRVKFVDKVHEKEDINENSENTDDKYIEADELEEINEEINEEISEENNETKDAK